nr:hypothetical protein Cbor_279 [Cedratvirus borely]
MNETFNTSQASGTTIAYAGTWNPTSTRQLDANFVLPSLISSSRLNLTSPPATSGLLVSVTYTFPAPIDLSQIGFFVFEGITITGLGSDPLTISIRNNGNPIPVGSVDVSTDGSVAIFVSPLSSSSTSLSFNFFLPLSTPSGFVITIDNITSAVVCVAWGSEIEYTQGTKPIQDVQRGDEIRGGKVARVIRNQLHPSTKVEAIVIKKHALGTNLPFQDTIVCADHYLVYQGKRRLAKSLIAFPGVRFVKTEVEKILPPDENGTYYFYDIQFDHEGEYIVNGLVSQSRSPYALVSPLPEDLYFVKDNYKVERTKNTITSGPEISYMYLLPGGEEVESLIIAKPNI